MKAQGDLIEEMKVKKSGYVGARLAKRIVTDCFARGVVRGAVEATHLTIHAGHPDPTRAESVKTAQLCDMALQYPLNLLETIEKGIEWPREPARKQVLWSDIHRKEVMDCPFWTTYGGRGKRPEVYMLSAYEFIRNYRFKMVRHPTSIKRHCQSVKKSGSYRAGLTAAGIEKVRAGLGGLVPGVDYRLKENELDDCIPLGFGSLVDPCYRHDWVIVRRSRPYVPVVYGGLGAGSEVEQAARLLVLFFPWVNNRLEASIGVPYIGDFLADGVQNLRQALLRRAILFGFPTEEVKRYVLNFCFVYFLPRSLHLHEGLEPNSDNECVDHDEIFTFNDDDLLEATLTHVRGKVVRGEDCGGVLNENDICENVNRGSKLFELTMQMFDISASLWLGHGWCGYKSGLAKSARVDMERIKGAVLDHQAIYSSALASMRRGSQIGLDVPECMHASDVDILPTVVQRPVVGLLELKGWLLSEEVQLRANAKQLEFLELIVDRVAVELGVLSVGESIRGSVDPLIWLLHGPPGTGKSYVLQMMRKFFDRVLGYKYGLHYEVTAFQAVNAMDLGGRTIHSAFGFGMKPGDRGAVDESAKRMAFWRWLIIDEISLTSADLLARAEERLRSCVPDTSLWKRLNGVVRPFAGVNVVFTGDFQQLKPPGGAYLADIPRSIKNPQVVKGFSEELVLAEQGRMILWGGTTQGVTELIDRERCKDEWWNEVVDELRAVRLSRRNWQYLHGIRPEGCTLSEEERRSRQRVLVSLDDTRLRESRFEEAPVIVANNDARYQINKDRAKSHSLSAETPLRWCVATDRASSTVLQVQECDKDTRIRNLVYVCMCVCFFFFYAGGYSTMIVILASFVECCHWPLV